MQKTDPLNIHVKFKVYPELLEGRYQHNVDDEIHAWVSRHIRRPGIFNVLKQKFDLKHGHSITPAMEFDFEIPSKPEIDHIMGAFCFCLMQSTEMTNQNKDWHYRVLELIGYGYISFNDMNIAFKSKKKMTLEFSDYTSEDESNTNKMRCSLEVLSININSVKMVSKFKLFSEGKEYYQNRMNVYIKEYFRNIGFEKNSQHKRPKYKHLSQMHVPKYLSIIQMPGSTFCLRFPIQNRSHENYLYQLLKISLSLNNDWTEGEFIKTISEQLRSENIIPNIHRVNKVLMNAFTLLANACEYFPDLNDDEDVEKFKMARYIFAIDCEDGAQDACMTAHATIESEPSIFKLCISAFEWMQFFATGMLTTSASTVSLNKNADIDSQLNEDSYVNHICAVMIPRITLSKWCRKIKGITYQDLGGPRRYPLQPFEHGVGNKLTSVIYLEGTNWCYGAMAPYESYIEHTKRQEAKRVWNSLNDKYKTVESTCLNGLGFYIFQSNLDGNSAYDIADDRIVSNFHKYPCSLWLPVFGKLSEKLFENGHSGVPIDFHLCDERNNGTYGVGIRDFIEGKDTIFIDPLFSFSKEDFLSLPDLLSYEYPVETLPGESTNDQPGEIVSLFPPDVSRLQSLKNQYHHDNISEIIIDGLRPPYVQFMINRIEKYTQNVHECISELLENGDFIAFDYKLHKIADGRVYIIEIRLYPGNI